MSIRFLLAFMFLALASGSQLLTAVEPWADPKLPVTHGLELWLDAGRIEAGAKGIYPASVVDGKLAVWPDASGKKRHLKQSNGAARPAVLKAGAATVVRFDGDDDHLRLTGEKGELRMFTAFLVLAPRRNLGGFTGFFSLNAPGGRDYETGLNVDMGPSGSARFTELNVEGKGFGGWRNLLKAGGDLGKLYQLEVRGDEKTVRAVIDGAVQGERPRTAAALALAEITVGARFYTNGPGAQEVRGPARCDIAEILLFNRALSTDESRKVNDYLATKHANLKQNLPPDGPTGGETLETVKDPPPVQVLVPGFTVKELPVDLTNINNVKYRADGTLVALGYNGDIWILKDTDGDGVEDKSELFYSNKAGSLRGPIGMALTPPGYKHGPGVFVASKGKVSLIVDTDNDGKADREIVVAEGWKEIVQSVDAVGVAIDPRDGSIYFGRGTVNYANGYLIDKDGKAHYDVKDDYGTIQKVSPDFQKRETVATGIRFPIGIHFNKAGDLFCSDQEGATWLPNGNPFDELLHIDLRQKRHYGFPPRHPRHLPGVIDEPSVYDYGPQHQSTCGFCFNEPVRAGGPTFGPRAWAGDVIMTGESRGRLFRTQLAKTGNGYVARNQVFACLNMLTVDCCVAPDGSLVVACHSGPPDWGTGPLGKGKLYKISYTDKDHPQPVFAWPAGPREVRVEFDRPVEPEMLRDVLAQTKLTAGQYVRAGDRFTALWPPYAVVQMQRTAPRYNVPVHTTQLTPDRRTLILATDPITAAVHYAIKLPGMGRPSKPAKGASPQHAAIDLDFDLSGVEVLWTNKNKEVLWRGWLPSPDLSVSKSLTDGSGIHDELWKLMERPGEVKVQGQVRFGEVLRTAVQPGSKLDHESPAEEIRLSVSAQGSIEIVAPDATDSSLSRNSTTTLTAAFVTRKDHASPVSFTVTPRLLKSPMYSISYLSMEDKRPRPFPLHRALLPWADTKADLGKPVEMVRAKELDGGSWARGRKVFFSDAAACYKCHVVQGQGAHIGPDLSNLIHRDYPSVYRDITQPSFSINPDYIPQTVTFTDDRVMQGVVRTEGNKLHIGDKDGRIVTVDRGEVASIRPAAVSIMPDDLLRKLGDERTRDLLTFLLTAPPSMPRDYVGAEKRPKPRTIAEVNAILAGAPNPPEKVRPIRVVLIDGPKDHGPGEHDYPAWKKAWAELLGAADNIEVATAREWPAKEEFQKADAMVFFQRGSWDAKRAADIDAFLERGGGVTYIHWAVDGQADVPGFAKRIGLAAAGGKIKFRHGPLELDFNLENKHPIARNFKKLPMVDESYWQLTGELARERVIAWQTEEKAPRPLFWTVEHGKGRVFVSIPGHYSWSFDDPLFRVLLLRGIAWTAKEPVDRFNDLVWPGADVAR